MIKQMFKKRINRSTGGNLLVFIILALLGTFMVIPFIYSLTSALKPIDEIIIFPPRIFVRKPTLDNFIQLGQIANNFWVPLSRYLFNSIFVSVVVTVGHIIFASMAAYPLAKHDFVGRNVINMLVRLSLLFTAAVTYIPQYIIMAQLHIINTYAAIILPALQSSLGLYLMQSFMTKIPVAMLEAARIDGSTEFGIYSKIVMPNVKPAWLTLMIFSFQGIWNSTGGTLIFKENLKVLPSILGQVSAGGIARLGVSAAAAVILMVPPIVLFLLSQNKVIETMTTSGIK